MSTYSPSLRIELIATGDQAGTWGNTTNTNLGTLMETGITGYTSVSVTSANQAFTALNGVADQARNLSIALTTTTLANFAVYAPPAEKTYIIYNTSAYVATIYNSTVIGNTTAAGTGVAIPAGKTVTVWSDGTNFAYQNNHLSSLTLTTPLAVSSGGTNSSTQQAAINTLAGGVTSGSYLRGNGTNVLLSTIQVADVPTLNQNTTGTASNVTGIVAVANGGTGASAAATARTNLGAGTVNSVGGTGTVSGLTLTGTVTTTGNLTLGGTLAVTPANFASQTANTFLAAPNGIAGTPTFRAVVAADIPTLNQNTTGNAATVTTNANLTGDVTSVGNATSIAAGVIVNADINAAAAIADTKLATIATAGKVSNSATTATNLNTASAIVARDASGNFSAGTITASLTGNATNVTGTVAIGNGGTGATTAATARTNLGATTVGGNMYTLTNPSAVTFPRFNADNTVSALDAATFRTAIGAGTSSATGTVTNVATGTGLSGGPITTTGTISLANTAVTPGAYTNTNITVDAQGRITSAASGISGLVTLVNDTATATDVYPLLGAATSGTLSTANTSNAKLLYTPSTGEFKSEVVNAMGGIYVNSATIDTNYTIASGSNGMSAGPITVASGIIVTVSADSNWTVV